ncbi:unnamed protein product [Protopolystoma xenopodis]|uniref:Uncharacterized protein n=1 Tax=Protopolystoma xenopodis TaxID=117903 RepID=A0A3S4ZZU8_9PLAT|nr:unnamed protein product [Protopolystoma xenopodis]
MKQDETRGMPSLSDGDAMKVSPRTRSAGLAYFRLDHLIEEFNFCSTDELDGNRRFRLIQLRNAKLPDFKSLRIPPFSRDIPSDLFKARLELCHIQQYLI